MLIVSDLHVGSEHGLKPDNVRKNKGKRNRAYNEGSSPEQEFIFDYWCRMCDLIQPDLVIVNGDVCEGVNYAENGQGNWTNDKNLQIQTARELLEMIDCDTFIGTQGSKYHTSKNMSADRKVIESLRGEFSPDMFVDVDGVKFHVRHKTPFSKNPRGQPGLLSGDMTNIVNDSDSFGHVDVFVRSHLHRFSSIQTCGQLGVITPGWKGRDDFLKESGAVLAPDIGFVLFKCKDSQYTWNPYVTSLPRDLVVDEFVYRKKGDL